jgi:hypothetical protein
VLLDQREIRIRTFQLGDKGCLNIRRRRLGEASLAGGEGHERQLIVFAAFDLQGPAIGAVRGDFVPDFFQRQRKPEPGGIRCRQIRDDDTE